MREYEKMLDDISTDIKYTADDFEKVKSLIYQKAGINLHSGKHAMVFSRLCRRVRHAGFKTMAEYLKNLQAHNDAAEWQEFINCLTTNLTSFFRESHHFEILSEQLKQSTNNSPKIWCAAASTGEEPYTIAITVLEALGTTTAAKIVCTDIDTDVLTKCKIGIYKADSSGLSEQRRKQYFMRGSGQNTGYMKIKPEVSKLTQFHQLNLISPRWQIEGPFDYIFCRNVMIYFDSETQLKILQNLHQQLRPDGFLFVGHSENFSQHTNMFRFIGKTVYKKI